MLVLLVDALWFILRGDFLSFALCYFVLVFFSPFSFVITSLGEKRANLSAIRTFVRFALVWFCLFPLPLRVWVKLRLMIVALPGHCSYLFLFFSLMAKSYQDDVSRTRKTTLANSVSFGVLVITLYLVRPSVLRAW